MQSVNETSVQASASSQTISPANIPIPQAKPDVNKTDAASPFALLMASTAKDPVQPAKKNVKDSSDRPAEPPVKQNDVKQNDAKHNEGRQNERDVAQTAAPSKPAAPAKSEKSDKDKDADETGKDSAEDQQAVAAGQQATDQQPAAPMVQASIPVPAETDISTQVQEDIAIESAVGAVAPSASTDVPPSGPVDMTAKPETDTTAQPQAQIATQDDSQIEGAETAGVAAAATLPVDTKPVAAKDTDKPAPVKTAAKSETTDTIPSETAKVEPTGDEPAQTGAAPNGDEPVHAQAKYAKTDTAKTDIATGDIANASKGHAAQDTIASNVKADTGTQDSPKTDASQANVHPAESDSAPAAVKPVPPQSASVSNAIFAINTIAAPQAAQHAQAPTATQHLQVTAQPAPNLPALAVEISAKSQSGAKQFDIRLDPPELGRVEVRLSIDATGKASAHLSADQPQTLSLLQKDAPILTRALREAGLDVAQDGLNFSLRQQAQGQNGNSDGNNGRFGGARAFSLAATASIDPAAASFAYRGPADGRVDIRV